MSGRIWVAIAGASAALACGDDGGQLGDGGSLDDVRFVRMVDFGEVPVGLRVTETLNFFNQSIDPIPVAAVEPVSGVEGDGYRFEIGRTGDFDIEVGSPTPLEFAFQASQSVSATAVVRVVLESGETAEITLQAATADALAITPDSVEFGPVTVGWPAEANLTIRNLLQRPVPVFVETSNGKATPTVVEGLGRFDIDTAVSSGRLVSANPLGPREEIQLRIAYAPDPQGPPRDRATWQVGACPDLSLCGLTVPLNGSPIDSVMECESEGQVLGGEVGITVGNLNVPETFSQSITCLVREDVIVDSLRVPLPSTSGFRAESQVTAGDMLLGGNSFSFELTFDPERVPPGTYTVDELRVQLRDPRNSSALAPVVIPIRGGHGRPLLAFERDPVDLQSVRLGTTRPDRITVTNEGPVPFTGRISLSPMVPEVFMEDAGRDLFIGADETISYRIEYTPLNVGALDVTATFESTDEQNPDTRFSVRVQGAGENLPPCTLEQTATSLDMGRSAEGVDNRGLVVLRNAGSTECVINGIRFAPGASDEIQLIDPPLGSETRLSGGESLTIEVRYQPESQLSPDAEAELEFYASAEPNARTVEVSGASTQVAVIPAPNFVDFRGSDLSCPRYTRQVTIMNGAGQFGALTSAEVVGLDAASFTVETPPLPTGIQSRPGGLPVVVTFQPQDQGLRSARLELTLNDSAVPFVVPLLGSAQVGGKVEESFTQSPYSESDVIFMIPFHLDRGDQDINAIYTLIGASYEAFIQPLRALGIDYRIGFLISRTDSWCGRSGLPDQPLDPGRHQGSCGYLSLGNGTVSRPNWRTLDVGEFPSEQDAWQTQWSRTVDGATSNQPLFAAYLSSHPDLRLWNGGLFRPNAQRHYVWVDNQDDSGAFNASEQGRWIRNVEGYARRNAVGATVIAGPRTSGCTNQTTLRDAEAAPRLRAAVAEIGGGPRTSICDNDFGGLLEGAAEGAAGIRRYHRLDRMPVVSSLRVFVDGVELPPQGYDVDASTPTVELLDPVARVAGADIRIEYTPVCSP